MDDSGQSSIPLQALGQAMLQQGYIPNSGAGGIGMEALNTYLQMQMPQWQQNQQLSGGLYNDALTSAYASPNDQGMQMPAFNPQDYGANLNISG